MFFRLRRHIANYLMLAALIACPPGRYKRNLVYVIYRLRARVMRDVRIADKIERE